MADEPEPTTDEPFRFLDHEEFQKLPLLSKVSYIRRAHEALNKMRIELEPAMERFQKKISDDRK